MCSRIIERIIVINIVIVQKKMMRMPEINFVDSTATKLIRIKIATDWRVFMGGCG